MSDERFRGFNMLHEALKDEGFRRRLTEADQLESQYENQLFYPASWPLRIRTDGDEMTIRDQQRQTVQEAIKKSAFEDSVMQGFVDDPGLELGEVLSRVRKLAGGHPQLHDTSVAGDIIVMIKNFKTE